MPCHGWASSCFPLLPPREVAVGSHSLAAGRCPGDLDLPWKAGLGLGLRKGVTVLPPPNRHCGRRRRCPYVSLSLSFPACGCHLFLGLNAPFSRNTLGMRPPPGAGRTEESEPLRGPSKVVFTTVTSQSDQESKCVSQGQCEDKYWP